MSMRVDVADERGDPYPVGDLGSRHQSTWLGIVVASYGLFPLTHALSADQRRAVAGRTR